MEELEEGIEPGRFNIPKAGQGVAGYVGKVESGKGDASDINNDDLTPEQMAAKADAEIAERARLVAEGNDNGEGRTGNEGDDDLDIEVLTKKAQDTPDELSEKEYKALVKAGILADEEGNDLIKAKLEELSKKKPEELTAEEKKFIEDNHNEPDLIEALKESYVKSFGIELKEKYTNDTEGALKLVEDASKLRVKQHLQDVLNANKKFNEVYQHFVVEGRSLDTFVARNAEPEFKRIKLEEINDTNSKEANEAIEGNHIKVLKALYKSRGIGDEETDLLIQGYQDTNKLFEKAKAAKVVLEAEHKVRVETALKAEEDIRKAEDEAIEKQWNTVRETVIKNNFNGFSIPATDLPSFSKAILDPINEQGLTAMDVIRKQKMTLEKQMLFDYMLFKDLQVPGLKGVESKKRVLKFVNGKKENQSRKAALIGVLSDTQRNILKNINLKEALTN